MSPPPGFLFVTCQIGAETAVKRELSRDWPDFRFAYSRGGFLTFKLPADHKLPANLDLNSVFARGHGFSLGRVSGEDLDSLARDAWRLYGDRPICRLHVWERDAKAGRQEDVDPLNTPAVVDMRARLRLHCPQPQQLAPDEPGTMSEGQWGEFALDCVLVQPGEWWVGFHRVKSASSRWPGGIIPLTLPKHAVSRAWLKMEEAIRWSELPIRPGAVCLDLGAAPGGTSQVLLERGMNVLGLDPAVMDPAVLEHPNFTHLRARSTQVGRREFRKVRWLMADMNVAPRYTLEAVESIVTHAQVNVRGLLLNLKLSDWKMADHVPEYLDRVRSWGYNVVRARQLRFNGQEICVSALMKPFVKKGARRPGKRPRP